MEEKLSVNDELLKELGAKNATNKTIDVYEVMAFVDFSGDWQKVRDWFLEQRICNKTEWKKAEEYQRAVEFLGKYPQTAMEYLDLWLEKNHMTIDYKRKIDAKQDITYQGFSVTSELERLKALKESTQDRKVLKDIQSNIRLYENIISCKSIYINTDDLNRKMRIKARELGLKFSQFDIDDVIQEWVKTQQPNRKFEIYSSIMNDTSPTLQARAKKNWKELIESSFDTTVLSKEVVEVVLRKFIWQVKRKMLNMDISNHLMPVILGPQGVGKTTLMMKFVEPLKEMKASTDFSQVTDDRNIDLWDNYVLVLDEMGYASKADIESVKHVITSPTLLRRIMRTNNTVTIRQNSTFIGASNKELKQLIKDETGVRRFIGLDFKTNPDWKRMNSVDMISLWQSVDERGPDPMISQMDVIRAHQNQMRTLSTCETWIRELGPSFRKDEYEQASYWYSLYKEYTMEKNNNWCLTYDSWKNEMSRLIKHDKSIPFLMDIDKFKFLGNNPRRNQPIIAGRQYHNKNNYNIKS